MIHKEREKIVVVRVNVILVVAAIDGGRAAQQLDCQGLGTWRVVSARGLRSTLSTSRGHCNVGSYFADNV